MQPNQQPTALKLSLSVEEAAEATSLSRATIYRRIQDRSLSTVRVGGRRLIPLASLEAMLRPEAA